MRVAGILVAALVVLAAAQAAAAVLAAAVVLALVVGLWVNPTAVIGFVAACTVAGLVQAYPLPCLGLVALMVAVKAPGIGRNDDSHPPQG